MRPLKVLHFADAHIDMANYGRHDPQSGLPVRVVDFLRALDQIVEQAIEEKVDLVLFAGDAYKDRNPQPTFQREWGQRMMRLSRAKIPTVLLVGNHDVSPAAARAHTLQEYETLAVPDLHVAEQIRLLRPEQLGLPAQIITIPWVPRSGLMRRSELAGKSADEINLMIEEIVLQQIEKLLDAADPSLPLLLLAHANVSGASYSSERQIMLGHELVLSRSLVADKRWDYVALGHIHKHQSLKDGRHPPIVYPGSIERIDFGEAREQKGFVVAKVSKGASTWEFVPLQTRQFIDLPVETPTAENFMVDVMRQLPAKERVRDAICRVQLTYPRNWETLLDEAAIYDHFSGAFSIQIQKHRQAERRARLGDTANVEFLSPLELLEAYWKSTGMDEGEIEDLLQLASELLPTVD